MRTILPHAPEHRSQGVFREIVERERLVLTRPGSMRRANLAARANRRGLLAPLVTSVARGPKKQTVRAPLIQLQKFMKIKVFFVGFQSEPCPPERSKTTAISAVNYHLLDTEYATRRRFQKDPSNSPDRRTGFLCRFGFFLMAKLWVLYIRTSGLGEEAATVSRTSRSSG